MLYVGLSHDFTEFLKCVKYIAGSYSIQTLSGKITLDNISTFFLHPDIIN